VDVFCEKGVFELEDTRKILTAAKALGFPLKAHVDEFENLGGVGLAVELGAISVEHAVKTSSVEIAALGKLETSIISLPCTPFGLAESQYSPAKEMLENDCLLALATDLNPGTAWCESMQFVMALACRYLKLTPAQALVAATINAAKAIGREKLIGSIEVGKQADILVLSVDDYRHLGYRFGGNLVETVIKKGSIT
jgi:imidazolonepropionase